MKTACPNCFQGIDTLGKEEKFFKEGKNCEMKCPKCRRWFLMTPEGVEQISSELEEHPPDSRSCRTLAHNY